MIGFYGSMRKDLKTRPFQYHKTAQKDRIDDKKEINVGTTDIAVQPEKSEELAQTRTNAKKKISTAKNIHICRGRRIALVYRPKI